MWIGDMGRLYGRQAKQPEKLGSRQDKIVTKKATKAIIQAGKQAEPADRLASRRNTQIGWQVARVDKHLEDRWTGRQQTAVWAITDYNQPSSGNSPGS